MAGGASLRVAKALAWWSAGLLLAAVALRWGELSASTYRDLLSVGRAWPGWLADLLIMALGGCFFIGLWSNWARGRWKLGVGVSGGVGAVVAYGASEVVKLLVGQDRPCRAILPVVQCPPVGDWSFPSNHATIAFAVSTAIVLMVRRRWVWVAYFPAAAAAAARVVEGVHYPHDVVAGAVVGVCTVVACTTVLADPVDKALSVLSGGGGLPGRSGPQKGEG